MKACLPHQSQQSAGLQGNGLAAGIGTGDDQKIECVAKSNIHRDNGALVEQRMSRSAEQNFPFGVESGSNGVHVLCQHSLGEDEVQLRQNGEIPGDGFRLLRHQGGEMGQNLLDFFFLLKLQLPQLIVHIYHSHRLNEECGAGGGLIMHHSGHMGFVFGLDREAVTPVTHGYQRVLQIGADGALIDHGIHLAADPLVGRGDLTAHIPKAGTRVVCYRVLGEDAAGNLVRDGGQGLQILKIAGQGILLDFSALIAALVSFCSPGADQKGGDAQKLGGSQSTADLQMFQGGGHVVGAGKGYGSLSKNPIQGVLCLLLHSLDLRQVGGGL